MSASVLPDLETAPQVEESLEYIERIVHADSSKVARAVEGMVGSAKQFESAWQRIVTQVADARTAEIQSARPQLFAAFEKRLRLLKDAHAVASWLLQRGAADLPDPDVLLPEIAAMERLKSRVFDRWESADDLEDLAARDFPLSTADLDRIGPRLPPPQSYFSEESKPF